MSVNRGETVHFKVKTDAPRASSSTGLTAEPRDLIVQEQLLPELRRGGWTAFSTSEAEAQYLTDDPADPSRKMIRQVLGVVAEYERSMIALRLRQEGTQWRIRGGTPPYGYRSSDGELVPVPDEQTTLARIREMRARTSLTSRSLKFSTLMVSRHVAVGPGIGL